MNLKAENMRKGFTIPTFECHYFQIICALFNRRIRHKKGEDFYWETVVFEN